MSFSKSKFASASVIMFLLYQFVTLTDWEFLHRDANTSELIQLAELETRSEIEDRFEQVPDFRYISEKHNFWYRTDEFLRPSLVTQVTVTWQNPAYTREITSTATLHYTFEKVNGDWTVRSVRPLEDITSGPPKEISGEDKLWPKRHFMFLECVKLPDLVLTC